MCIEGPVGQEEDENEPQVCPICFGSGKGWFPDFAHLDYHAIVKHPEYWASNGVCVKVQEPLWTSAALTSL
jgi:hypothetical protein